VNSNYYYLFGLDAISAYNLSLTNDLISKLKEDSSAGTTYHYNEELESPTSLLEAFSGWGDFIVLTKPEYDYIRAKIDDDNSHLKDILAFMQKYAATVRDDEDIAYVELVMDNHICIEFEEVQYYIPKSNSSWTEDDDKIYDFFNEHLKVI